MIIPNFTRIGLYQLSPWFYGIIYTTIIISLELDSLYSVQTTNKFVYSQLIVYYLFIVRQKILYDLPLVIIATVKTEIPIKIKHSEMNNTEQVKSVVLEDYGGYDKIKVSIFLIY